MNEAIEIHAPVIARLQEADEVHTRAQRAATDVEQRVLAVQAQRAQQFHLERAASFPALRTAAQVFLVRARLDFLGG